MFVITVCECRKGYWHQQLDEASSFLTTFNTELCKFQYMVMPFGVTVAGDVFQRKHDECFGKLKQVSSLQMISWLLDTRQTTVIRTKHLLVCYKQLRSVMSSLIMTSYNTRKIRLISLVRPTPQVVASQPKAKCQQ